MRGWIDRSERIEETSLSLLSLEEGKEGKGGFGIWVERESEDEARERERRGRWKCFALFGCGAVTCTRGSKVTGLSCSVR